MKTHIKHTFIIGALGFCLAACSDFLDEKAIIQTIVTMKQPMA